MSSSLTGSRGASGNKIPKGYAAGKLQQFSPEQMDLFKGLFSQVGPGSKLAGLAQGDEAAFAPIEEQAQRDFQTFSGQNASRFSGLGMGARHGSGFKNAQTQGAIDFASQLAQQRQGLQRQALMDLLGISESLLGQRPYENFLIKKQPKQSFLSKLIGIGAPAAGAAIGGAFGGIPGAQLGGQLGGSLASGFQQAQF